MRRGDWSAIVVGAVALTAIVLAAVLGCIGQNLAQTIILAITASIILWYTVETSRLRREAETRAINEARPRVYFEVESGTRGMFPIEAVLLAPSSHLARPWARPMRFMLQNFTPNPAKARVTGRLRLGVMNGQFDNTSPCNGHNIWQITPYDRINGEFDITDLLRCATPDASAWLDGPATLSFQVDLYWPDGTLIESVAKEYHFRLVRNGESVSEEFWPEVSPTVFGTAGCPRSLPEGLSEAPRGEV
jgi:hypothetical protein